jgi:predicted dehydrogenase
MGFWKRLITGAEEKPRLRLAFVGEGGDKDGLRQAYREHPRAEIVAEEPLPRAGEAIKMPGVRAAEIFAGPGEAAEAAMACLEAGIHVSVPAPLATDLEQADELIAAARRHQAIIRVRQPWLYYEPFTKAREIIASGQAGWISTLKLTLKVTGVSDPELDRSRWLIENESSYLGLAEYLAGPVAKVYAQLDSKATHGIPCTNLVMWKYRERHRYGYLQIDFTPGLHVRTFTEPIHRAAEITGNAAKIFINRGEGQLLRQPALLVRGRDRTIVYELIKDDWREVWPAMAQDMISAALLGKGPRSGADQARSALRLALAARESSRNGEEIPL